jgi:mevalonate kinase
MIWFQKGLAERISCPVRLSIVVAVSKPHGGTLQAVQAVKQRLDSEPMRVTRIFDSIGEFTHQMRVAIEKGEISAIGKLMNENQGLLTELGVSTPELNYLCDLANSNGAFGAKLTGAGGGGCVIALCYSNNELVKVFNENGYSAFAFEI